MGPMFPGDRNSKKAPLRTKTEESPFMPYYSPYQKVTTSWAGFWQGAMVMTCITGPLPW